MDGPAVLLHQIKKFFEIFSSRSRREKIRAFSRRPNAV
jgi:hypothetical protein